MPLELFAILVPLGIALIVVVVKMSGLSKSAILNDQYHANSVFLKDFEGEEITSETLLTSNRNAALLQMRAENTLGLVEVIGDRFITRILNVGDVRSISNTQGDNLAVDYNDFTHPKANYSFENSEDRAKATGWFNRLKET